MMAVGTEIGMHSKIRVYFTWTTNATCIDFDVRCELLVNCELSKAD